MSACIPYEVTVRRLVTDSITIYAVTAEDAIAQAMERNDLYEVVSAQPEESR